MSLDDMTTGDEEDLGNDGEDMGIDEFGDIKFNTITPSEGKSMEFENAEAAYFFYNDYGMPNGFSVRKDKKSHNKKKEIVWQNFVCSREGYREAKYVNMSNRKREHRTVTRCGCKVEMCIRLDMNTVQWYVSSFNDDHNHQLLAEKFTRLLRSHRKMSDADIAQFNCMRKKWNKHIKMYGSFATQCGGYNFIGFRKKELYNQIEKERKL